MEKTKNIVARMVNQGAKVKEIMAGAKQAKRESASVNMVQVFLWAVWFKLWRLLKGVAKAIVLIIGWLLLLALQAIAIVGTALLAVPAMVVGTLLLILTTPLVVELWPRWCARTAAKRLEVKEHDPLAPHYVPERMLVAVVNGCCKALACVWGGYAKKAGMTQQRHFLQYGILQAEKLPVSQQLSYYKETVGKETAVRQMSPEAIKALWDEEDIGAKNLILVARGFTAGRAQSLFKGNAKEQYLLQRWLCGGNLTAEVKNLFVQMLAQGEQQAASYLQIIIERGESLESQQLLSLIASSLEVSEAYWRRHTLPEVVLEELVEKSLCDPEAFELLLKAVKRDGISSRLAQSFFRTCKDTDRQDRFIAVLEKRSNLQIVSNGDLQAWQNLCIVISDGFDAEVEAKMSEKQYDIYLATGHTLSDEGLESLLLNRDFSYEGSYFDKLLEALWLRKGGHLPAGDALRLDSWKWTKVLAFVAEHQMSE
ncbi:MAG: hypothetical protein IJ864_04485 [Alphaproteobacteria bacterium]|nr:hypothetical protein [Alphaproteobacteria bacterium]